MEAATNLDDLRHAGEVVVDELKNEDAVGSAETKDEESGDADDCLTSHSPTGNRRAPFGSRGCVLCS